MLQGSSVPPQTFLRTLHLPWLSSENRIYLMFPQIKIHKGRTQHPVTASSIQYHVIPAILKLSLPSVPTHRGSGRGFHQGASSSCSLARPPWGLKLLAARKALRFLKRRREEGSKVVACPRFLPHDDIAFLRWRKEDRKRPFRSFLPSGPALRAVGRPSFRVFMSLRRQHRKIKPA